MVDSDILKAPKQLTPNILPILIWPDERLNQVCENITTFDDWLKQVSLDMFATMKYNNGVGLAAPQVGILANVITISIDGIDLFFANPEIVESSERLYAWDEGCLSVPGYFEKRRRPQRIVVKYKNINGYEKEKEFQGLFAFAIQHEIDHLNGKVFVDDLSSLKKDRVKNKIKKFTKFSK